MEQSKVYVKDFNKGVSTGKALETLFYMTLCGLAGFHLVGMLGGDQDGQTIGLFLGLLAYIAKTAVAVHEMPKQRLEREIRLLKAQVGDEEAAKELAKDLARKAMNVAKEKAADAKEARAEALATMQTSKAVADEVKRLRAENKSLVAELQKVESSSTLAGERVQALENKLKKQGLFIAAFKRYKDSESKVRSHKGKSEEEKAADQAKHETNKQALLEALEGV